MPKSTIKISFIPLSTLMKLSILVSVPLAILRATVDLFLFIFAKESFTGQFLLSNLKAPNDGLTLVLILLSPLITGVIAAVSALFLYIPVKWVLQAIKGIQIEGEIAESTSPEIPIPPSDDILRAEPKAAEPLPNQMASVKDILWK